MELAVQAKVGVVGRNEKEAECEVGKMALSSKGEVIGQNQEVMECDVVGQIGMGWDVKQDRQDDSMRSSRADWEDAGM